VFNYQAAKGAKAYISVFLLSRLSGKWKMLNKRDFFNAELEESQTLYVKIILFNLI